VRFVINVRGVPFYRQDGGHWATLPVEIDRLSAPPRAVELIDLDEVGQLMRWR
jgi:hypothetical protein